MTQDERLAICKTCANKKFDFQKGIICNITNEPASFESECADYQFQEEKEPEYIEDSNPIGPPSQYMPAGVLKELRLEQNLPLGILAGLATAILGAILWAGIAISTGFVIGYIAIAVGAGVGFAIRFAGKGLDQIFGIAGGLIAILGCALGNLFTVVGFISRDYDIGIFEVLSQMDFSFITDVMVDTFSPMDLVFYAIAAYEGYRFAFRTDAPTNISK